MGLRREILLHRGEKGLFTGGKGDFNSPLAGSPEKDANNGLTWLPHPSKILLKSRLNSKPERK